MAEAESERGAAKGGRRSVEGAARGRAVPLGPPKFINRRLLTGLPTRTRARTQSPLRLCGAELLRAARVSRLTGLVRLHVGRPAVLAAAPVVQLDYYVEALFQKLRPLALGLRSRAQERVVNLATPTKGVALDGASGRLVAAKISSCFVTHERGDWMARYPVLRSLATVSLEEALAYLDAAEGDELTAADNLARDRIRMEGSTSIPDEMEIHHALFLLRRARGLDAPSFDLMRVQLRRRHAA